MAKESLTTDAAAEQITRGNYFWKDGPGDVIGSPTTTPVSYGFRAFVPDTYVSSDGNEGDTFSRFNETQIARTEQALQLYADVANISFTRVNPTGYTNNATMLFGNYANPFDGAGAFASFPGSRAPGADAGDFWYNTKGDTVSGAPTVIPGSYDFLIVLHELAHAMGLDHPGEYNAGPDQNITYGPFAEYREDTWQYTVASYFEAANTGADHTINGRTYYARTLLLHDIAAMQRLYGVNETTRTDDSVYGFGANAGDLYKLDSNAEKDVLCIWDAGGTDTLDFSGYTATQVINLNAEKFSSVGGLKWNWSIAKDPTEGKLGTIEHATGGSGVDTIYGNWTGNKLSGNAGRDALFGGGGNDTLKGGAEVDALNGGAGVDTADFSDRAFDLYVQMNRTGKVTVFLSELANDTLNLIENFVSGSGYDVLLGDAGVNRISGGAGDDVIQGNAGKDILDGGAGAHDGVEYRSNSSGVRVELAGGLAKTVFFGAEHNMADDTIRNFEDVTGGSGDDIIFGDRFANALVGGAGNDLIRGNAGKDKLDGGAGIHDRVDYATNSTGGPDRTRGQHCENGFPWRRTQPC
jgi:serralysin